MKDPRLSDKELDAAVSFAYGGGAVRSARKAQARTLFKLFSRRQPTREVNARKH